MYQELQTDLEKAIQVHSSAIFQKIKWDAKAYNFSDAIPTAWNTRPSAAAGSATEVLKEEQPSCISYGIADGTLDGDSGVVSGIAVPSHTSAEHETEDSDVVIVATTPAPERQALMEIPISQLAKDTKPVGTALRNVFKVTPTEQAEVVSTIQSMMDLEDQGKDPNTVTGSTTSAPVSASTATATYRDTLAMQLKLSAKELKHLQEMVTSDVGMEHLPQTAAQEAIDLPESPSLPPSQEPLGEIAVVQLELPFEGLMLLAGDTTIDSGDKEDGKVNKECLIYDFGHGRCPLRPNSHDGSWSKETHVLSQARMAAYTSDSPKVHALQCGFRQAWLQALGLKKDMSFISDDMRQPIQLHNGSTLPPYTWPADNSFSDDDAFGYPTHDLSFIVEGLWEEFPYLRRMEDFPYPQKYKCKAGTSETKPKFGMYYGVPTHMECGLPVSTLGIIQGALHPEGALTIYTQEVRDCDGTFHQTTTKTCAWYNKVFSNGLSAMNHMRAHYWIALVCPLCSKRDSYS